MSIARRYKQPQIDTGSLYRDIKTIDTASTGNLTYDEISTNPALRSLIAEGINRNLDLRMAYTRIHRPAYFRQSFLEFCKD